jgi:uncharacterized protein YbjT (DUF2867 family)
MLATLLAVLAGCSSMGGKEETVLVGGATGRQGTAVVNELLVRGYQVRAITRNPESAKAAALRAKGVEVVRADYADKDSLLGAMQGIERMFFYSGFSRNEIEEGRNVVAAAKEAGIRFIAYSSGAAAEPGVGLDGAAKMQVEEAIVASGIPYTVFRPVAFMENFDRQQARIARTGIVESRGPERELYFISIADVGFLFGEAFDDPVTWSNRAINIASDKMTVQEYVDTYSRVMGREINYTVMPLEDYLNSMPKPLRPLFRWYHDVGYEADVDALRAAYPNLLTLESYLWATGWANWQPPVEAGSAATTEPAITE